jgi:zinc D-Ala-D-Ala dipeptidase
MIVKQFVYLFVVGCLTTIAFGQIKKPEPPAVKPPFAGSMQMVVVTTKDWAAVQGTARLFERRTRSAAWKAVGGKFSVVVGRNGLGTDPSWLELPSSPVKHEGDGRSPAGRFPLTFAFGADLKPSGSALPFTRLEEFTECVDDVNSNFYNKVVNRMQVGNFDWKSSEKMAEVKPQYDLGVFVAYNSYPAVDDAGSCIFLHIWKDANTGTAGCTAMERPDLERIVAWLQPKKDPYLVQLTESEYSEQQQPWNLPKLK